MVIHHPYREGKEEKVREEMGMDSRREGKEKWEDTRGEETKARGREGRKEGKKGREEVGEWERRRGK